MRFNRLLPEKTAQMRSKTAFTLLEVMVAIFIFFTAMFSILALTSQSLRAARLLKTHGPTAGMVAADLTLTNKLEEGVESGTFDVYKDYSWEREIKTYGTNGLFEVEIVVLHKNNIDSTVSLILYRPDSQPNNAIRPGQR